MNNDLKQLIEQLHDAERQADEIIKPRRSALYLAALEEHERLNQQLTDDSKREALLQLIEKALADADEDAISIAPLMTAQFVALNVQHPDVRAGNGAVLLDVFADAAKELPDETRRQALTSLLLIAAGKAPAGLYRFPADPLTKLALPTLRVFSSIINPKSFEKICSADLKRSNDLKAVSRLVEQFTPPAPPEPKPAPVKVLNVGEGTPLKIGPVSLPGYGKVTEISHEDLEAIQDSPLWQSGIKTHDLEILQ